MNFVIDQFQDFMRTYERALNSGKIKQNDPFLSKIQVVNSYKNPKNLYEKYLQNIFNNFQNNFLDKKKVLSHDQYFKEFLSYVEKITPKFPITFTAWQRSKYSSILTTGLALDIAGLDIGDDELKETFIESENFPFFLNMCNNFGFSITKNSPWIIVADLSSPASTVYHKKNQLSSERQIFSQQFLKTAMMDFEYIKQNLFVFYNNLLLQSSYIKEFDICNNKTIKNNLYRDNININKFNNIYNNNYFIEYYNNIRYLEENKPYSESDKNKFTKNAKNLQKTFDISRAIGYINEQYRSVYRTKPGGLNHVLRKISKKSM